MYSLLEDGSIIVGLCLSDLNIRKVVTRAQFAGSVIFCYFPGPETPLSFYKSPLNLTEPDLQMWFLMLHKQAP